MDYGLVMLHDPAVGYEHDEKTAGMLRKFKDAAIKMLANKTSLSESKIDKMMTDETWLNAQEALKLGFITEIIQTGKQVDNELKGSRNVEELILVFNKVNNFQINSKTTDMKQIALSLGLQEGATEEQILQAIQLNKKTLERSSSHIDTLIALGEANGHINAENKEKFKKLAAVDYDTVFSLLSKPVTEESAKEEQITLTAVLAAIKEGGSKEADQNDQTKWTFDRWQKEDPNGLLKMKQTDPVKYQGLALAHVKK